MSDFSDETNLALMEEDLCIFGKDDFWFVGIFLVLVGVSLFHFQNQKSMTCNPGNGSHLRRACMTFERNKLTQHVKCHKN